MVCEEKMRLVKEYVAATTEYQTAVITVKAGSKTREFLDAARETCAKARLALRHHKGEHGC